MLTIDRQSPLNVNSTSSNIKFGEKKDILKIHFIKQCNGNTNNDVIRFSSHNLALRIMEYVKVIPYMNNSYLVSYEIDAKDAEYALKALTKLQSEHSNMWIPLRIIHSLLGSLQEDNYITPTAAKDIEAQQHLKWTLHEYEGVATEYRDVEKALTLAHYYNNSNIGYGDISSFLADDNLYWLLQAFVYSGKRNFGQLIDLEAFFKNIYFVNTAPSFKTSVDVFKDNAVDILEAMARSGALKMLKFSPYTHYTREVSERIGNLLKKTTSIHAVALKSTYSARAWTKLNSETITPIVDALKTNTSIMELHLSAMELGDIGILKIIDGIKSNPNSKLAYLFLDDCGMTNISGKVITEVLKNGSTALKIVKSQWLEEEEKREMKEKAASNRQKADTWYSGDLSPLLEKCGIKLNLDF
ncbi:MAG: hypothetical protein H0U49_08975 [Parachlamydiaceae bacterium]|nr:hypothetical protein [Parachlamydiaceae bacterium]